MVFRSIFFFFSLNKFHFFSQFISTNLPPRTKFGEKWILHGNFNHLKPPKHSGRFSMESCSTASVECNALVLGVEWLNSSHGEFIFRQFSFEINEKRRTQCHVSVHGADNFLYIDENRRRQQRRREYAAEMNLVFFPFYRILIKRKQHCSLNIKCIYIYIYRSIDCSNKNNNVQNMQRAHWNYSGGMEACGKQNDNHIKLKFQNANGNSNATKCKRKQCTEIELLWR